MVATASLAACAAPRLADERADWIASWQLSKYVDLSSDQRKRFDADVETLLAWHRSEELLRYSKNMRSLAEAIQQPMSSADVTQSAQLIEAHWDRLVEKMAPDACAQMASFTDPQVASVLQRVDKNIAKDYEEWVAPVEAEVRKHSERRLTRSLKRWLGPLNSKQYDRIKKWSAERELTYSDWLDERRHWRGEFAQALAERKSPKFCTRAQNLFSRSAQTNDEKRRSRYQTSQAVWMDFLADFSSTLTPDQRQHMRAELLDLAEDSEALAAESPG